MPASAASKVCTVPQARDGKRECQWRWISTASLPTRRDPVRPFAERPVRYCDIPNFRSNGGRKSEAARDGFRPTTCTRLTSAVWQLGQSVASLWRCALPATRERCSAISSSFSSLSCRGQPAPSGTPAPVGDGYSCCRALRGLWLFGAVLQGLRGAFTSTMRPATAAVPSLPWAGLYLAVGDRLAAEVGDSAALQSSGSLLMTRGAAAPFAFSSATSRNKMRRW